MRKARPDRASTGSAPAYAQLAAIVAMTAIGKTREAVLSYGLVFNVAVRSPRCTHRYFNMRTFEPNQTGSVSC